MSALQLKISNPELAHKGKIALIKEYLTRCSSRITTYGFTNIGNEIVIIPVFKSKEAFDRVEAGIREILDDMCEELDSDGEGCEDHYNGCDCGGNDCGDRYCFPCNACEHCLNDD